MTELILASSSPRRIDMMKKHGFTPKIMPADIDETIPQNSGAQDAVMFLALKKALHTEQELLRRSPQYAGSLIIAADTVVHADKILGKPASRKEAREMLLSLRGRSHYVSTGVAIIKAGMPVREVFCDTTKVFCKDFSLEELEGYLDTDEPYDKAGAYAIQGIFSKHIDHIEGSFDTVVGFPIDLIKEKISQYL